MSKVVGWPALWLPLMLVAWVMALSVVAITQNEPFESATFHAQVDYVEVAVRVVDGQGHFVPGLTASDFRVRESGKSQTVVTFKSVDIPFIPDTTFAPKGSVVPTESIASNGPIHNEGRVYLFVLDDLFLEPEYTFRLRSIVRDFIVHKMSSNDSAAVVLTSGARIQAFTRDRQLLIDAAEYVIGAFDPRVDGQSLPLQNRVRTVITDYSRWLGAIKERHKALVLISPNPLCRLITDARGMVRDDGQPVDCGTMFDTAVQSNVSIYSLDPRGLVAPKCTTAESSAERCFGTTVRGSVVGWRGPQAGVRTLAEETGGFAVAATNKFEEFFDRIVRENSAYYLIGYYSTSDRADSKFRKHDIKVNRAGVRVFHRAGYRAPRSVEMRRNAAVASAPTDVDQRLKELASSPLPISSTQLRLAGAAFRAPSGRSTVSVVVEIPGETLRPTEEGGQYRLNIALSIGLFDLTGKPVALESPRVDLSLPLSEGAKIMRHGIRIRSRITVSPGRYRLWAGATQTPSLAGGSVMTDISVPDFDRVGLSLSGIVVATTAADAMYTVQPNETMGSALRIFPVADREFSVDGDLLLYGEIYENTPGGDLDVRVVVRSRDQKSVYEAQFDAISSQPGRVARIPLSRLGSGSYVATVEARTAIPTPISVARTVAFQVK